MAYDGSIRINVDVDSGKADKAIDRTNEKIEKETASIKRQELEIDRLKRQLEAYESGKKKTAEQKDLEKSLKQAEKEAKAAGDELERLVLKLEKLKSSKANPEVIAVYERKVEEAARSLDEAEMKAAKLKAQLAQVTMDPSATATVADLKTKLGLAEGKLERSKAGVSKLGEELKRLKAEKVQKIKDSFAKMPPTLENVSEKVSKVGTRITSLAGSVLVFGALSKAFTKLRESVGSYIKTNDALNSNLQRAKANLLTAFQPIWEYAVPALQTLTGWLSKATAYVASFVNALFGKNTSMSQKSAENLYKEADALDEVADSAKKASSGLADFDELNNRQTDTTDFGTTGAKIESSMSFDTDFSEIDDETNTFWDTLAKKLNPISTAAEKLWKAVKKFGTSFAEGFIGFFVNLYNLLGGEATVDGVINAVAGAIEWLAGVIDKVPPEVAEACGGAIAGIVTAIVAFKVVSGIAGIVKNIGSAVVGLITMIMAHPYAAAAVAIAGIAGALIALSDTSQSEYNYAALDAYLAEVDKAIQKSKDLNAEIAEFLNRLDADIINIDTEFEAIRNMADRYMDLVEKQELSNDERTEMLELGKTLSEKIPGFADAISEETGAYAGTREELERLIGETEKYYKLQAYREALIEIEKKKLEIKTNIPEIESEVARLTEELEELLAAHEEASNNWNPLESIPAVNRINEKIEEVMAKRDELNNSLQEEKDNLGKLNTQWDEAWDYIRQYSDEAANASMAIGDAGDSAVDSANKMQEATEALGDSIDGLSDASNKAGKYGAAVPHDFYSAIKSGIPSGTPESIEKLSDVSGLQAAVTEAEKYGRNVATGFYDGLDFEAKYRAKLVPAWAQSISGSFAEEMEIHSPSRLFGRFADYTVDGFNLEIEDRIADTERAVKKWAEAAGDAAFDTNFSFYNSSAPVSNYTNVFDTSKSDGLLGSILSKLGENANQEQVINITAKCNEDVLFQTTVRRNKQHIRQTGKSAYA